MNKGVVIICSILIWGCSSPIKMVTNPPFVMGEATFQQWVGGREESGSGILLSVLVQNDAENKVDFQQAFFRGKISDIEVKETPNGSFATAKFWEVNKANVDMVMHSDPTKEVGNQPPIILEKFPFELNDNECVISYQQNGRLRYYKLTNLKQGKQKIHQ